MTKTIIQRLQAYAVAHYDQGFDTVVECWEEREFQSFLDELPEGATYKTALAALKKSVSDYNEYADDIRATAF